MDDPILGMSIGLGPRMTDAELWPSADGFENPTRYRNREGQSSGSALSGFRVKTSFVEAAVPPTGTTRAGFRPSSPRSSFGASPATGDLE